MSSALHTYRRLGIETALALAASCVFASSVQAADAEDLYETADAEDVYEAAAMMHTHVAGTTFLVDKCSIEYPNSKDRFQADLAAWQSRDARAIGHAKALWQEMEMSSPQSAEEVLNDRREAEHLWDQMRRRGTGQPENIGEQRCRAYFERLVAGAWRKVTPKMYSFLEN